MISCAAFRQCGAVVSLPAPRKKMSASHKWVYNAISAASVLVRRQIVCVYKREKKALLGGGGGGGTMIVLDFQLGGQT